MKLSPVFDINGFLYGLTIEDCWQASKVFPWHFSNYAGDGLTMDNENSKLTKKDMQWFPNWHFRSRQNRFSGEGKRHRSNGNIVNQIMLYSYYNFSQEIHHELHLFQD